MSVRNALRSAETALVAILAACGEPATPLDLSPGRPGALRVTNVTTGGAFDIDGYAVRIDGGPPLSFDLNQTVRISSVAAGPHEVELSGLAPNCSPKDGATRSITVEPGATAEVSFVAACTAPAELSTLRIVYASARWDDAGEPRSSIVAVNADGSGAVRLTSGDFYDREPDVSPDARKIAFATDRTALPSVGPDIWVMNADGSSPTRLISAPASSPDWSPDGRRIAFSGGGWQSGGPIRVFDLERGDTISLTGPIRSRTSAGKTRGPPGRQTARGWPSCARLWVRSGRPTSGSSTRRVHGQPV